MTVTVVNPNGTTDQDATDDTVTTTFIYYPPVAPPLTESFEGSVFPPPGWDIVNPDNSYTWQKITGIAKTGSSSVAMLNYDYQQNGQKDYLRLPQINITNADSAFMTFQVAAAVQTPLSTLNNPWDTLEVLASTDCGATYTTLYKRWGSNLVTHNGAVTQDFIPNSNEWRKDSVNLTPYINAGPVMLAFLNITEDENNIYLDDINVYSEVISPKLKQKGFLVTPNPTTGTVAIQFYPNPSNLRGIVIYNMVGQKIAEQAIGGNITGTYTFDLSRYASGVYIVQVVLANKTITTKVLKR